jgi:hypothetical protein
MNAVVGIAIALAGALIGATAADVVSAEFRARLDSLPFALIRLAGRRVPREVRKDLVEEWTAELHEILHGTEALPITRLFTGTRYALGLARVAPSIGYELTGRPRSPIAVYCYVALLVGSATTVLVSGSYRGLNWWTLAVLIVVGVAVDVYDRTILRTRRETLPSGAVAIASVVLLGPIGAALVGVAVSVWPLRGGLPLLKRAFNAAQFALCGYIAARVYLALGDTLGGFTPTDLLAATGMRSLLVPFAAAWATYNVTNCIFIGVVLWLTGQRPRLRLAELSKLEVSYLASGSLALLIVMASSALGSFAAALALLAPLVRWLQRSRMTT